MSVGDQFSLFMIDIWSRINKIEEQALATGLESDISITEINIIAKIAENQGSRMSDAAKSIGITLATLTVACDKLENKGIVLRARDQNDRRVVNVSLTPRGMAAYEFHRHFHAQMFQTILGELSEQEEKVLENCFHKLVRFLEAQPEEL